MAPSVKADAAQRRARLLAGTIRTFLADWDTTANPPLQTAAAAATSKQKQAAKSQDPKQAASSAKKPTAKNPTPQDEAITKLMQDLDEKINKAKRCKLEDMYDAVAGLEEHEQHALSSITTACGSKMLPEKGGNAATVAIRDILVAATAAHSYRRPQMPEASKSSAAAFRQRGLPACSALQAGFHAGQLLRAGYSTAELVRSGVRLDKLRAAGASVSDLYSYLPAQEAAQLSGTAGAERLKAAGYTATAVQEGAAPGAFSAWDLKLAGYDTHTDSCDAETSPAAGPSSLQASPSGRHAAAGVAQLKQQLQQQDVLQYFRHQIVPLMQMQADEHTAPLLLGTRGQGPAGMVAAAGAAAVSPGPAGPAGPPQGTRPGKSSQKVKWQLQGPCAEGASTVAATGHDAAAAAAAMARAAAAVAAGTSTAADEEGDKLQ